MRSTRIALVEMAIATTTSRALGALASVMTTLFRRPGRPVAASAKAAALTVGLVAAALALSSPASAQTSSCADPVLDGPDWGSRGTRCLSGW